MVSPHLALGRQGEAAACCYLQQIGYRIYTRNQRLSYDEIDIIAYDPADKVVVFAEVKTRRRVTVDYDPSLGYTSKKQQRLLRSARRFMAEKELDLGWRIDLITVEKSRVLRHYKEINNDC